MKKEEASTGTDPVIPSWADSWSKGGRVKEADELAAKFVFFPVLIYSWWPTTSYCFNKTPTAIHCWATWQSILIPRDNSRRSVPPPSLSPDLLTAGLTHASVVSPPLFLPPNPFLIHFSYVSCSNNSRRGCYGWCTKQLSYIRSVPFQRLAHILTYGRTRPPAGH